MLRAFWLAGLVIAALVQGFTSVFGINPQYNSAAVLMIAWTAAALYSVGAAITMFCAETEERTRVTGDRSSLPRR